MIRRNIPRRDGEMHFSRQNLLAAKHGGHSVTNFVLLYIALSIIKMQIKLFSTWYLNFLKKNLVCEFFKKNMVFELSAGKLYAISISESFDQDQMI